MTGRCILVTASRRIGGAIARELLARGAAVCVVYHRTANEAEQIVAEAQALGWQARAVQADLSTHSGCLEAVDTAARWQGRLDGLINVASRYDRVPLGELDEAAWARAMAVDLSGTWWCCQAAVPWLRASGRGRIVNFADWVAASHRPRYLGYMHYYVAKCGVIALTEALALELASDGVLVNCLAPGPIAPPEGISDAKFLAIARNTPLGRWGGVSAVVQATVTLLETDFVTGETIRVDGGRHLG